MLLGLTGLSGTVHNAVEETKEQLAEEGAKLLLSGEMPDDAQLEALELDEPRARGMMAVFQMEYLDGAVENGLMKETVEYEIEGHAKTFEIEDWTGYPSAVKPKGPFRVLEGEEYDDARKLANRTNAHIHAQRPDLAGMQIHEIHPVKFGGSPTDIDNKIALSPKEHARYTAFWNRILREQQKEDIK